MSAQRWLPKWSVARIPTKQSGQIGNLIPPSYHKATP